MFITIHTFHIWPRGGGKKTSCRDKRTLRRHTHIRLSDPPWLRHTALRTRLQRFAWMLSFRHYDSYKLNLYCYIFFLILFGRLHLCASNCTKKEWTKMWQRGTEQKKKKRNWRKWCLRRGCVAGQSGNGPKSSTPSCLFTFSKNHSLHHTTRHWFRFFFCLFSFFS